MVTSNQPFDTTQGKQPVTSLVLRAPAKINLVLRVLGKRADGYHELLMLNEKLELADEITIWTRDEGRGMRDDSSVVLASPPKAASDRPSSIVISCDDPSVPCDERNLCWKTAIIMKRQLAVSGQQLGPHPNPPLNKGRGIHIHIAKRIPVAAGLGGGSSDAAAVLVGLNKLLELGLSREKLAEIGVKIGADVPFFLCDGAAICEGIGERVTPVIGERGSVIGNQSPATSDRRESRAKPRTKRSLYGAKPRDNQLPVTSHQLPNLWILLVNPKFPVATKWAYEEFDRIIARNGGLELTGRGLNARLRPDLNDLIKIIHNDLEEVVSKKHPEIKDIKTRFNEAGAKKAWMSGSGPTVVGLFESREARDGAGERLENPRWRVISTTNFK